MLNDSSASSGLNCHEIWEPKAIVFTSYVVHCLLVLPPSLYVLYLGFQQRRRQKPTSHSDYFTFHMISFHLISSFSILIYTVGYFIAKDVLLKGGFYCQSMIFSMQMEVHCFTCVDRYLAVVHPVTYLKLRKTNGIRLRNAAMAGGWLLGLVSLSVFQSPYPAYPVATMLCYLSIIVVVISFCCISVLCVLNNPGPSDHVKVDRSKRRAFKTITAIMETLLVWLFGMMICIELQKSSLTEELKCQLFVSILMFRFPSDLVLPLLYLKKDKKLPSWKK